jgi:hypothetical protein
VELRRFAYLLDFGCVRFLIPLLLSISDTRRAAILEVSEEEFTQLNAFRKTFEEVEE